MKARICVLMKNILVTLSLILIYSISFSQDNYQKGFYIDNELDTIQGYIGVKEWGRNPWQFGFKKQLEQNEPQIIELYKVRSFSIQDYVIYQRFFVSISMNDVRLSRRESVLRKLPQRDTVFLKLLSKGKFLSLFSFNDELKERFYVMPADEHNPEELIYELEKTQSGGTRIREIFKQQLYTLAAKAGRLSEGLDWKLKNASYTRKSLIIIANSINGSGESNAVNGKSIITRPFFYGGAGLAVTDLIYEGAPEWSKASSPSYNPYFLIGFKYRPNAYVGRYSIRAEVSVISSSFKTIANKTGSYGYVPPQQIEDTFNQLTV